MNPQDFDALLATGSGFYTADPMVNSGLNEQLAEQARKNVQAMQTPVPMGSVPAAPNSPDFQQIAQDYKNNPELSHPEKPQNNPLV